MGDACFNDKKYEIRTAITVECKDCIIVIKNVPCLECNICGEITFNGGESKKLELLFNIAKKLVQEIFGLSKV